MRRNFDLFGIAEHRLFVMAQDFGVLVLDGPQMLGAGGVISQTEVRDSDFQVFAFTAAYEINRVWTFCNVSRWHGVALW